MHRAISLLAGAGLGAGLMYMLDPRMGRRRRALVRDKMVSMAHEAGDAAEMIGRDMKNRARGLASGDWSVLAGGKRALANPLRGGWSPSGRALMTGIGTGLFAYGLTRSAPTACILGTIGIALAAEGVTNAGLRDISDAACSVKEKTKSMTEKAKSMAGSIGISGSMDGRTKAQSPQTTAQREITRV
jgi:hypothetical protein